MLERQFFVHAGASRKHARKHNRGRGKGTQSPKRNLRENAEGGKSLPDQRKGHNSCNSELFKSQAEINAYINENLLYDTSLSAWLDEEWYTDKLRIKGFTKQISKDRPIFVQNILKPQVAEILFRSLATLESEFEVHTDQNNTFHDLPKFAFSPMKAGMCENVPFQYHHHNWFGWTEHAYNKIFFHKSQNVSHSEFDRVLTDNEHPEGRNFSDFIHDFPVSLLDVVYNSSQRRMSFLYHSSTLSGEDRDSTEGSKNDETNESSASIGNKLKNEIPDHRRHFYQFFRRKNIGKEDQFNQKQYISFEESSLVIRAFNNFMNDPKVQLFFLGLSGFDWSLDDIHRRLPLGIFNPSLYKRGDYSLSHTDNSSGRKIAFIFYFSKDWESNKCGGAFVWCNPFLRKNPDFNSVAIFKVTKTSGHFVQPVFQTHCSSTNRRLALSGWYYW